MRLARVNQLIYLWRNNFIHWKFNKFLTFSKSWFCSNSAAFCVLSISPITCFARLIKTASLQVFSNSMQKREDNGIKFRAITWKDSSRRKSFPFAFCSPLNFSFLCSQATAIECNGKFSMILQLYEESFNDFQIFFLNWDNWLKLSIHFFFLELSAWCKLPWYFFLAPTQNQRLWAD